ncbi:MAG TPA: hypothetical protein DD811_11595 [Syntrophomonas sp.]|jgi:glutaconate CoA-transferase subunit A|nr:hypothetical protein [Syntrophomonas sp.]
MKEKLMPLASAVKLIKDDMLIAMGGNGMHRNPLMFSLALTQQPLQNLKICGAAPGIAADVMMASGQADTAYFGFFGLENEAGLAPGLRQAMEGEHPRAKAMEGS